MIDKANPHRLSDTVVPGRDYAAKIKIGDILGQDVLIVAIDKVTGSPEFSIVDEDTGEIVVRDYWNVEVAQDDKSFTFSTGAVPINKVLTALQQKIASGEAELPLLATFRKEGRTYIVE